MLCKRQTEKFGNSIRLARSVSKMVVLTLLIKSLHLLIIQFSRQFADASKVLHHFTDSWCRFLSAPRSLYIRVSHQFVVCTIDHIKWNFTFNRIHATISLFYLLCSRFNHHWFDFWPLLLSIFLFRWFVNSDRFTLSNHPNLCFISWFLVVFFFICLSFLLCHLNLIQMFCVLSSLSMVLLTETFIWMMSSIRVNFLIRTFW